MAWLERSRASRILLFASTMALCAAAMPVTAAQAPSMQPPARSGEACPRTAAQLAAERAGKADGKLFHKLTELPPADMYAAVYRHLGTCEVPMIVKYRVGRQ
jgi:hypothetical protein